MLALRHFAAPVAAMCLGVGIVGCSSEPKAEQVPPGAQLLVQGDQQLSYTAAKDGNVYVYDSNDQKLLYSGKIEKGQTIAVDPDEDRITVDNKLAQETNINAGNRHRIYFQADPKADRVVEERTTVRETTAAERVEPADTTIRREEKKTVETQKDGDVTVKKETTIKTE